MKVSEINNLLELFFERYKLQDKNSIFLTPLNNNQRSFTWEETKNNILKLSKEISNINQKGDRCLLISENRPEWMISDLSIMLSGSITVPAYTTYVEKDYEYIINDCQPKVLIVSNQDQFSKIEKSKYHIYEVRNGSNFKFKSNLFRAEYSQPTVPSFCLLKHSAIYIYIYICVCWNIHLNIYVCFYLLSAVRFLSIHNYFDIILHRQIKYK